MPQIPGFYSSEELQKLLGVSKQRVNNLARALGWQGKRVGILYPVEQVEKYLKERSNRMAGKDYRYCARCGAGYNALRGPHECDPRDIAILAQAERDDAEVREAGQGAPRPAQPRPNPDYR